MIPRPAHSPTPSPGAAAAPTLAEIDEMADHAQRRLKLWFNVSLTPTVEQLGIASQALWRLTAVRKTLMIAAGTFPLSKSDRRKPSGLSPEGERLRAECDRIWAELQEDLRDLGLYPHPAKRPAAAPAPAPQSPPAPSSGASVSSAPLLSDLPGVPTIPEAPTAPVIAPAPAAPTIQAVRAIPILYAHPRKSNNTPAPMPSSALSSIPNSTFHIPHLFIPPACPALRSPRHTMQATLRQVNRLCKQADISDECSSTTIPEPVRSPVTPGLLIPQSAIRIPQSEIRNSFPLAGPAKEHATQSAQLFGPHLSHPGQSTAINIPAPAPPPWLSPALTLCFKIHLIFPPPAQRRWRLPMYTFTHVASDRLVIPYILWPKWSASVPKQ